MHKYRLHIVQFLSDVTAIAGKKMAVHSGENNGHTKLVSPIVVATGLMQSCMLNSLVRLGLKNAPTWDLVILDAPWNANKTRSHLSLSLSRSCLCKVTAFPIFRKSSKESECISINGPSLGKAAAQTRHFSGCPIPQQAVKGPACVSLAPDTGGELEPRWTLNSASVPELQRLIAVR